MKPPQFRTAMKPPNPKHKFQVSDMNWFPRTSATTRNQALKFARYSPAVIYVLNGHAFISGGHA